MVIEVGDAIPSVTLRRKTHDGVERLSSEQIFAGKKVVLFAVPGAFTETCSEVHLPGFVARAPEIVARGVAAVVCTAVNDPSVLAAWAAAQEVGDDILMLADGNGELAQAMGLELDLSVFGMGRRSRRYAAIVDDGVVRYLGVEWGREVGVSSAEAVLAAL